MLNYSTGPASLFAEAARQARECSCFEFLGDNPECPVHGVKAIQEDGSVVPASVIEYKEEAENAD